MYKTANPADWFPNDPVTSLVRCGRTFGPNDKRAFLKTGAAAELAEAVRKCAALSPDDPLVHILATGSTETWGPNRNGDGFSRYWSRLKHGTYVKHAKYYRNHAAGETDPHYGLVKASAYNDEMDRVELIVQLFGSKRAADRAGPLARVADWEMEKLANDGHFPTSMGCGIPYDVCDLCHNQARTRAEYCGAECPGGGCRDFLGKIANVRGDLRAVFVDNPDMTWKDISGVGRPADRISAAIAADYLHKRASAIGFPFLAARGADIGAAVRPSERAKLGAFLDRVDAADVLPADLDSALAPGRGKFAASLPRPETAEGRSVLAAMALSEIVLPFRAFASWTGREKWANDARIPRYETLAVTGWLDSDLPVYGGGIPTESATKAVAGLVGECRLTKSAMTERLLDESTTVRRPYVRPTPSADPQAEKLARDYAIYRLDAISEIFARVAEIPRCLLTASASGLQNRID